MSDSNGRLAFLWHFLGTHDFLHRGSDVYNSEKNNNYVFILCCRFFYIIILYSLRCTGEFDGKVNGGGSSREGRRETKKRARLKRAAENQVRTGRQTLNPSGRNPLSKLFVLEKLSIAPRTKLLYQRHSEETHLSSSPTSSIPLTYIPSPRGSKRQYAREEGEAV